MYSKYYQAKAVRKKIWFIAGCLRNEDHWAFDRSLDAKNNLLEFFVSPSYEEEFLSLMNYFKKEGLILELKKLPNRCEVNGCI
jgi:hypothetical protein